MQQKIKILEEHLKKSDQELQSHVQLYNESVEECRHTLSKVEEEGKRKGLEKPVNDMPWEFWSRLLLTIDV